MKNRNKTTKFPVARIKKIMQKDEEVGKVAQATPIVISKALELFLQLVIDEAARVTNSRGSKKVEAYHLKHAIEKTEMLDFLKELVEGVPDPSAGGTVPLDVPREGEHTSTRRKGKKAAANTAADDGDEDGSRPPPTKRRRRRKKEEVREADNSAADGDRDEVMNDVAPPHRPDENWDLDDESGGY
ncbi:histone-fold-containing protein [Russula compacta]|nr:histone-fold-containing protein [Russula compacta]